MENQKNSKTDSGNLSWMSERLAIALLYTVCVGGVFAGLSVCAYDAMAKSDFQWSLDSASARFANANGITEITPALRDSALVGILKSHGATLVREEDFGTEGIPVVYQDGSRISYRILSQWANDYNPG